MYTHVSEGGRRAVHLVFSLECVWRFSSRTLVGRQDARTPGRCSIVLVGTLDVHACVRGRTPATRVISIQLKHQLAIRIPHSGCTVAVLNILGLAIPPIARLKVTDVDTRVGGYRVVFAFVVWALRYV